MIRCLVIGGCGFIGSHVVDALIASGYETSVLDRAPERFRNMPSGVDFFEGDYGNEGVLLPLLEQSEVVIHLAWATIPKSSAADPVFDIEANLVPTIRLGQACLKCQNVSCP